MNVSCTHSSSASSFAQGDFDHWWNRQGEWVEEANQRRGGSSGVQILPALVAGGPLLYSKRQIGHLYRSLRHPRGRPTILRELDAYQALAGLGIRVPVLVFAGARHQQGEWQALLVTEALTGFVSLDQWYATHPDALLRSRVIAQTASMLASLHRARWQHGCCYPKHIFVRTDTDTDTGNGTNSGHQAVVEVALLDLEKCRRRWRPASAAARDMDQLSRRWQALPAADLQSLKAQHQALLAD